MLFTDLFRPSTLFILKFALISSTMVLYMYLIPDGSQYNVFGSSDSNINWWQGWHRMGIGNKNIFMHVHKI